MGAKGSKSSKRTSGSSSGGVGVVSSAAVDHKAGTACSTIRDSRFGTLHSQQPSRVHLPPCDHGRLKMWEKIHAAYDDLAGACMMDAPVWTDILETSKVLNELRFMHLDYHRLSCETDCFICRHRASVINEKLDEVTAAVQRAIEMGLKNTNTVARRL